MCLLKIDTRESKLMLALTELGTPYEKLALVLGDIELSSGVVYQVFERKTVADMAQSIVDSRYKEQKERLMRTYDRSKITYVLEGANTWRDLDEKVKGAVINTMMRDNIKVIFMRDVSDTAAFLTDTLKRMQKDPDKYAKPADATTTNYTDALNVPVKKRDMMDAYTFSVMTLCLVPGVSKNIARAIVDGCGGVAALASDPEALDKIANTKTPSGKRVGPAVAQRLISYLKI